MRVKLGDVVEERPFKIGMYTDRHNTPGDISPGVLRGGDESGNVAQSP